MSSLPHWFHMHGKGFACWTRIEMAARKELMEVQYNLFEQEFVLLIEYVP